MEFSTAAHLERFVLLVLHLPTLGFFQHSARHVVPYLLGCSRKQLSPLYTRRRHSHIDHGCPIAFRVHHPWFYMPRLVLQRYPFRLFFARQSYNQWVPAEIYPMSALAPFGIACEMILNPDLRELWSTAPADSSQCCSL